MPPPSSFFFGVVFAVFGAGVVDLGGGGGAGGGGAGGRGGSGSSLWSDELPEGFSDIWEPGGTLLEPPPMSGAISP